MLGTLSVQSWVCPGLPVLVHPLRGGLGRRGSSGAAPAGGTCILLPGHPKTLQGGWEDSPPAQPLLGHGEGSEGASEVPAVPPPRHHYHRSRSAAHPNLPAPPRPAAWAGLGAASTSSIEGQTELQLRTGSEFPCSVWQPRFPAAWRGGGEAARLAAAHLFAPEPGSLIWFVSGILGSTGCPLG